MELCCWCKYADLFFWFILRRLNVTQASLVNWPFYLNLFYTFMTRKKRTIKFTVIVFRDQSSFIAKRGMKDFFFRGGVGGHMISGGTKGNQSSTTEYKGRTLKKNWLPFMPMGGGERRKENHKIIIYRNSTHFLPHLAPPPQATKNGRSKRSRGPTVERITLTLTDIGYLLLLYHTF